MPTIVPVPTVNKATILSWLADKSNHTNPVVYAIYKGLSERIIRGEFDKES